MRRVLVLMAIATAAVAAVLLVRALAPTGQAAVAPPVPRDFSALDSTVAALISATVAEVDRDRGDADRWLKLGLVYEASELYDLAAMCYQQSVELDARRPRGWYHLALLHARDGELERAIEAAERARALDPSVVHVHWRLGMWRLEQGDLDSARASFERALEIHPSALPALVGLARAELQAGRFEAAIQQLERSARAEGAQSHRAYIQHLFADANRRLGRPVEWVQPSSSNAGDRGFSDPWQLEVITYRVGFQARLQLADDLDRGGQLDEAIALYRRLMEDHPQHAGLLTKLGAALGKRGQFDESIQLIERAIALDPGSVASRLNCAYAYAFRSRQGDQADATAFHDAAMRQIDECLRLDPRNARAHGLRGDLHTLAGRHSQAIDAWRQAAACDQTTPQWELQIAKLQIVQQQWTEAAQTLGSLIERLPNHAEALALLGGVHASAGSTQQAIEMLERAATLRPQDSAIAQQLQRLRWGADPDPQANTSP